MIHFASENITPFLELYLFDILGLASSIFELRTPVNVSMSKTSPLFSVKSSFISLTLV